MGQRKGADKERRLAKRNTGLRPRRKRTNRKTSWCSPGPGLHWEHEKTASAGQVDKRRNLRRLSCRPVLVFSQLRGYVQRRVFSPATAASCVRPFGSAPRVAFPTSSDSCGIVPRGFGVTLGCLVVACDHIEFRLAEVLRVACSGWHGVWNEYAWRAARGCPTASQAGPDRPDSGLAVCRLGSCQRSAACSRDISCGHRSASASTARSSLRRQLTGGASFQRRRTDPS